MSKNSRGLTARRPDTELFLKNQFCFEEAHWKAQKQNNNPEQQKQQQQQQYYYY